jgi:hypothetical protein
LTKSPFHGKIPACLFKGIIPLHPILKEGVMNQRLLLLAVLIFFSVLPVRSQPPPVQVATTDMPEATAFNNGHKMAIEGWVMPSSPLHAVYTSANDVFYSSSSNRGGGWSTPVNVSQTSGPSRYPAIVRDSVHNTLFVVWQDSTPGQNDIYLSSNQGGSWSTPINVSNTSGQSIHPALEADHLGRLHLVYADNSTGNNEIYYQCYQSGAWLDTLNLSRNTGLSDFPSIGAYGDDVYVCWEDKTSGNYRIFRRFWNGTTWSTADTLTSASVSSRHPSLSCPASWDVQFSVTWEDSGSGGFGVRVIGINYGGGVGSQPDLYPVISNVGTTWAYLCWQDRDTVKGSSYYFMEGGWGPYTAGQGHYPSLLGSNLLYTQGDSIPYRVMYSGGYYPIGVEEDAQVNNTLPLALSLHPNPSPGRVTVELSLPQLASLSLEVYDLRGALLRTLARTTLPPGRHEFLWDGRDTHGHPLPSGVYLIRASAGPETQTARVLLLR